MASLEYPDMLVNWQSTFSNSRYGLGEHILGDKGTIQHMSGSNDMVTGKSRVVDYLSAGEDQQSGRVGRKGRVKGKEHMASWFECIRDRKTAECIRWRLDTNPRFPTCPTLHT